MKKIIIDSGSTKADIAVLENGEVTYFQQKGINPSTQKAIMIEEELLAHVKESDQLFFYGAGVHTPEEKDMIKEAFKTHNVALEVQAESDILGACRATAGKKKGIISILGTGSNSCVYDGKKIIANIPALGYVFGDEGGGSRLGISIIRSFLNKEMPQKVAKKFQKKYNIEPNYMTRNTYIEENSSRFLAGHVPFLNKVKGKWKKKILADSFQSFIDKRIKKYKNYEKYKLFFVGSIAYNFHKELDKRLEKNGLSIESITRYPIVSLVDYHKKHDF